MIELVSPDLPPPKKEEIRQQYVSRRDTSMFPEALKGDIISAEKLSNTETLQQISHLLKTNNHSGLGKYIRSLPLADQPAALTLVFRVVAEAFDTNYLKDQNPASIWSTLRDTLRSENPPNGKYQFDSFEADQFEMSHPEHNCVGITLLWSKYIEEKLGFPSRVKNVIRTSYSQ